jgi:NSS family neurotransmitter:Na+ symporter
MGQAFYSVGLGGSIMLVYGSYINDEADLPRDALLTVTADAGAALLASLFIVPAILVFGLDMGSGPGLIFNTMPQLFAQMPGGRLVGSLFLLILTLVAFLSAIAAIEVFVSGLSGRRYWWTRGRLVVITFVLLALMMIPSALHPPFIGWADMIFGSGMLVTGGLIAIVALTRGLGRSITLQQILPRQTGRFVEISFFWLRWAIPAALIVVLGVYIFSLVSGTEVS